MESARYLIIGGGPAGTTAAATIRQHDADGRIVIVNKESHLLYSRPSLAAFMRGEASRDSLLLRDEKFYATQRIEVWRGVEALKVDLISRTVTLSSQSTIRFEKLLIATGGRPRPWKVAGAQLRGVQTLRTLDDAEAIIPQIRQAKHVTVVGGGFITLEMIQLLARIGVATTVVMRGPYYWSNVLDEESGRLLQSLLVKASNIDVLYETQVHEVVGETRVEAAILSNGRKVKTDLVLVNTGISFETEWLEGSKLTIENGIVVDQHLATEVQGVYAAGDIALFYDALVGMYHQQGNWNNATLQGQIAGQNMAGHTSEFAAVTTYSIHFMNHDISFIGQTSQRTSVVAIPRGSARSGAYGRILVKNGKVVGATLINRFAEKTPINRLISSQVAVDRHLAELADETISLKDLADLLGA